MHTHVAKPPTARRRRIAIAPTTPLGRWAAGLGAASIVLLAGSAALGTWGASLGLVCGILGGVVALVAIIRGGERAITVFAALLPWLLALGFVLAEPLIGHD
jgi:hypothetical protein